MIDEQFRSAPRPVTLLCPTAFLCLQKQSLLSSGARKGKHDYFFLNFFLEV